VFSELHCWTRSTSETRGVNDGSGKLRHAREVSEIFVVSSSTRLGHVEDMRRHLFDSSVFLDVASLQHEGGISSASTRAGTYVDHYAPTLPASVAPVLRNSTGPGPVMQHVRERYTRRACCMVSRGRKDSHK
jgi:hypothetical protein